MRPSDNQVEASELLPDDVEAELDFAFEKMGVDPERLAIQQAAAAEEARTAALVRQVAAAQERPEPIAEPESLVSVMSKGRENLLQKMREHAADAAAKRNSYAPPPLTERQRNALAEEQAAGQRARERHEAELALRPPPKRDPSDGTSTPVHRPGNLVPDPTMMAPAGFVAGTKPYDHNANKVIIPGQ